jgi:integrase
VAEDQNETNPGIEQRLTGYIPVAPNVLACWDEIRDPVLAVVRATNPADEQEASERLHICAKFTAWAVAHGLPLAADRLYTEDNVEWHTAANSTAFAGVARTTRAKYRSELRQIGRTVARRGSWSPLPPRIDKGRARSPYTAGDIRRLREIGPQQRTATRRRILRGALGLCYGAGARPFEVADTIGDFVEELDGVVVVHIPGQFARTVPVLPDVAEDVLDLARQFPDSCIFSDRKPKTDWMRDTLTNVEVPAEVPRPDAKRLRQTWMVQVATLPLRLPELQYLSGLQTLEGWERLDKFIPRRDAADLGALIGGAR